MVKKLNLNQWNGIYSFKSIGNYFPLYFKIWFESFRRVNIKLSFLKLLSNLKFLIKNVFIKLSIHFFFHKLASFRSFLLAQQITCSTQNGCHTLRSLIIFTCCHVISVGLLFPRLTPIPSLIDYLLLRSLLFPVGKSNWHHFGVHPHLNSQPP